MQYYTSSKMLSKISFNKFTSSFWLKNLFLKKIDLPTFEISRSINKSQIFSKRIKPSILHRVINKGIITKFLNRRNWWRSVNHLEFIGLVIFWYCGLKKNGNLQIFPYWQLEQIAGFLNINSHQLNYYYVKVLELHAVSLLKLWLRILQKVMLNLTSPKNIGIHFYCLFLLSSNSLFLYLELWGRESKNAGIIFSDLTYR